MKRVLERETDSKIDFQELFEVLIDRLKHCIDSIELIVVFAKSTKNVLLRFFLNLFLIEVVLK